MLDDGDPVGCPTKSSLGVCSLFLEICCSGQKHLGCLYHPSKSGDHRLLGTILTPQLIAHVSPERPTAVMGTFAVTLLSLGRCRRRVFDPHSYRYRVQGWMQQPIEGPMVASTARTLLRRQTLLLLVLSGGFQQTLSLDYVFVFPSNGLFIVSASPAAVSFQLVLPFRRLIFSGATGALCERVR